MQDVSDFSRRISTDSATTAFFADGVGPVTVTRAPGRLDVMGGVGDYSGCLVAEMTIAEAALVGLRRRSDAQIRLWSAGVEKDGLTPRIDLSLTDLYAGESLLDYPGIHARLTRDAGARWAAYVAGCFYVLLAEKVAARFEGGADILLDSRVPLGAGVSSSAAIEVATMQAINVAYGLGLDGVAVATLAQTVENRVVGAPSASWTR